MTIRGTQSQGDTQPASPWVYEQFRKDVEAKGVHPAGPALAIDEGESGHIDLLAAFDQVVSNPDRSQEHGARRAEDSGAEEEDIDVVDQASGSEDVHAELFPESKRFCPPKTPLAQGTKRKRDTTGNGLQTETPKLPVNPFTNVQKSHERMRLSQLFEATQAVTSPHVMVSDGLHERPSPHFNQVQRPSTAESPSSPARLPRLYAARAMTEPQVNYVSMKESQEARERLREQTNMGNDNDENSSDDEFGFFSPQAPRLSSPIVRSRLLPRQQDSPTASPRRPLRGTNLERDNSIHARTDKLRSRHGKSADNAVIVSDDPLTEGAQGNITEEETERESEGEENASGDEMNELGEDNKENVEVPRTTSRLQRREPQTVFAQPTPSRSRPIEPNDPAQLMNAACSSANIGLVEAVPVIPMSSPRIAVCDSQLSQRRLRRGPASSPAHGSGPQSSLESRNVVLQSQLSRRSRSPRQHVSSTPKADSSPIVQGNLVGKRLSRNSSQHDPDESSEGEPDDRGDKFPAALQLESIELGGAMISNSETHGVHAEALENGLSAELSIPSAVGRSTIPETTSTTREANMRNGSTDRTVSAPSRPKSSADNLEIYTASTSKQSMTTLPFETAPEHLTPTSRDSFQQPALKTPSNQVTLSRARQRRTLGDIADELSPPKSSDEFDANLAILNNDDIEFQMTVYGVRPAELSLPQPRERTQRQRSFKPTNEMRSTPDNRPTTWSPISTPSNSFDHGPPSSPMTNLSDPGPEVEDEGLFRLDRKSSPHKTDLPQTKDASLQKKKLLSVTGSLIVDPVGQQEQHGSISHGAMQELSNVACRRVFAHFNGNSSAYYSATCLGLASSEEPRFKVRFDDGTEDTVSAHGIKRLELRSGDMVKIDLPGARGKIYLVKGMKGRQDFHNGNAAGSTETLEAQYPEVDIHGYTTVVVTPKIHSYSGPGEPEVEQIEVPLGQVYLTQIMWGKLKDREYHHLATRHQVLTDGLRTPCEHPSTPSTPLSRTRRLKPSIPTITAPPSNAPLSATGLFKSMIFILTNIHSSADLAKTKMLIESQGGTILDDGFDSLFHIPALNHPISPTRKSNAGFASFSAEDDDLHLLPQFHSAGFTCLLADKHCRRAKYIQALALGIPCLATRWVGDCIAKSTLAPWQPYLLPAGESAFLGHGAVRSRVLSAPFPPSSTTLSNLLDHRSRILADMAVLLFIRKGEEENAMKPYPLLVSAMGPRRMARASSLDAMVRAVREASTTGSPWDLVITASGEKEAERVLLGGSASATRKRRSGATLDEGQSGRLSFGRTRVVGNEVVVQSLIAGMLVD